MLGAATPSRGAAMSAASLLPEGASSLRELSRRLNEAPRRRDFKTVPMILQNPDQWDHEALSEVIAYRGGPRQAWDNTELGGAWLNVMRNALNTQIWAFKHPDFLVVSATRGTAQLALFNQVMWEKYGLASFAGGNFKTNSLLDEQPAGTANPADYEKSDGAFSAQDNSIPALQRRGVVFLACHNAIWDIATRLIAADKNPDKLALDALAADLTNHLIPDAVVTPGAVGTLPELQQAGFHYAS
jgi:hypothetical protein